MSEENDLWLLLAVSPAASLGLRAVRDARDLDIVVGSEIPRVVRGRLRAIRHNVDGIVQLGLFESPCQYEDVILAILDDENWQAVNVHD